MSRWLVVALAIAIAFAAARTELAEHAFLSLTVLGDRCRPELRRVFDDAKATPEVRSAALDILRVHPELPDHIRRAKQQGEPAIDRAHKWEQRQ